MNQPAPPRDVVLFVTIPAALGGSNRSLANVLDALSGSVTRVVAAPAEGDFADLVRSRNLADDHIPIPSPRRRTRVARLVAAWRVFLWALQHRRSVVAIHANALTGVNLAAPASIVLRIPMVAWIHDPVGSRWGRILGPVLRATVPSLRVAAVSRTAGAVAVDNGLCREIDRLIPNPIDPADVRSDERVAGALPVVGVLGGASERKGFDLLPAVAERLADADLQWSLWVTAKSDFALGVVAEFEKLEGVRLALPGKDPDVRRVYARCDIVFCPSRAESFCRVAAEAMLNGIPVVASDIEPLADLLGDDEAGLLFPAGDVEAASGAIRRLLEDPELRRQLGEEGRRRASRFTSQSVASALLDMYSGESAGLPPGS